MALYWQTGVSVESWVEMSADVAMRCEVDPEGGSATLYFGRDDFVLHLGRENLGAMAELTGRAHAELTARKS